MISSKALRKQAKSGNLKDLVKMIDEYSEILINRPSYDKNMIDTMNIVNKQIMEVSCAKWERRVMVELDNYFITENCLIILEYS